MFPSDIDRSGLVPQTYKLSCGRNVYIFRDSHIDIVRLDFVFPAGSAVQTKKLQAAAAIRMIADGTDRHSAMEIAEFMDFRGIVMEKNCSTDSATLTVYTLSRHLPDLLPMLCEIIDEAAYPDREFGVYVANRRMQLLSNMHKTSFVARIHFYENLFGPHHPEGMYATPSDYDSLTVEDVREFHRKHISLASATIVLSGNVTDETLRLVDKAVRAVSNENENENDKRTADFGSLNTKQTGRFDYPVPKSVQTSIRVGRLLPVKWDDMDYTRFMVVSTALGGYFGSRLMQNIREDKGYTYGINSMTRICRSGIIFSILSDVAADKAELALAEVMNELARMRQEPMPADEMALVCNCMLGDFMRSIDGIFERAERFVQMLSTGVTEHFTDNFMSVLSPDAVTPEQLQSLAAKMLQEKDLLVVTAGNTLFH